MDYAAIARKIRIAIFDDAEARGRVLQDSMEGVIERELRTAIVMEEKCSPNVNFMGISPIEQPTTKLDSGHHLDPYKDVIWPKSEPVSIGAVPTHSHSLVINGGGHPYTFDYSNIEGRDRFYEQITREHHADEANKVEERAAPKPDHSIYVDSAGNIVCELADGTPFLVLPADLVVSAKYNRKP